MIELPHSETDDRGPSRGVLWRGPAVFQERIRSYAKHHAMTQNAFITSGMLFSSVVFEPDAQEIVKAVLHLCEEMVDAADRGLNVLCSCRSSDWQYVGWFVRVMADAGLVSGLQIRTDDLAPDAVFYTFRFTKEGLEVWRAIGKRLASAFSGLASAAGT